MTEAAQIALITAFAPLVALLCKVLWAIAKKYNLDIDEASDRRVERIAKEGVVIAKIEAAKVETQPGPNLTVADENKIAADYVAEVARKEKLPTPSTTRLEAVVTTARASFLPPAEVIAQQIAQAESVAVLEGSDPFPPPPAVPSETRPTTPPPRRA